MSTVMELLSNHLGDDQLQQISRALGSDADQTRSAVGAALPALLGVLSHNAANPAGAQQLHAALEKDHDGSLLENLGGFLGGGASGVSGPRERSFSGDAILEHMLGNRRGRLEQGVEKVSGLQAPQVNKLLGILAPMVLGAIGSRQRQQGLDPGGLSGLLKKERTQMEKQTSAGGGLIGRMLDQDGDGDFDFSDIMKLGMNFLFRRK